MAELLHKTLGEVDALPEAEIEEWQGYLDFKSECCPNCGGHPSHLMDIELVEFVCGICDESTKKVAAVKRGSSG